MLLQFRKVPIDPNSLPQDPEILKQMLVDVTVQLDKTQRLLRQLLAAKTGVRSEQLTTDQLRLFAQELGVDPGAAEDRSCSHVARSCHGVAAVP